MHGAVLTTLFALIGQTPRPDNIDFRQAAMTGWEGSGFYLTAGSPRGPGATFGICSSDAASSKGTGMVRYVLTIPPNTATIRFQAFAAYPLEHEPDSKLDIVLAGAGNQIIPKMVRSESGWSTATHLLSRWRGKPREYSWDVSGRGGQTVQIVALDKDPRPGCFVYCTGFALQAAEAVAQAAPPGPDDFANMMVKLQQTHGLAPMARYDSSRFTALGNASESFMKQRLKLCEIFYDLFYDHFKNRGFALRSPDHKLMLAVFDSQRGFEAYLGGKVSAIGMYHPKTNRLILYDLKDFSGFLDHKKIALKLSGKLKSSSKKNQLLEKFEREFDEFVEEENLATTMHEAAHQLSFNCGMFNRNGDCPAWLGEGLACYCEATDQGDWQIGARHPNKIADLRKWTKSRGRLIPLERLLKDGIRLGTGDTVVAYAQSWALFRMLMDENPAEMRAYMTLIYPRRTSEYRLADFRQCFGNDLDAMEQRYQTYIRNLVEGR